MWTLFITVAVAVPVSTAAGSMMILLGAYSPGIVAIALTAWREGRAGLRALLLPILRVGVPVRYYVFAIAFLPAIKLGAALLHRVLLGGWPRFGTDDLLLVPLAIALSTPFQAGEEIGWRGYALPRLAARFGLARASLLLGAIWATWHVPQFYVAGGDSYQQSFVVWSIQVVALSVAFAWLYARTGGSLFLVMLLHAAINNTKDIVPSPLAEPAGVFTLHAAPISWLSMALLWLSAAILLSRLGDAHRRTHATVTSASGPSGRT